jgi:hypothetical protein
MKIKSSIIVLAVVGLLSTTLVMAQDILADTDMLGLSNTVPQYDYSDKDTKPKDKITYYDEDVYVREYNDFGKPMVEVNPGEGPKYYFSEDTLLKPSPEDGVRFRDTPNWMVKEW